MAQQGISVKNKVLGRVAQTFGFISVVKGTMAVTDRSGRFNGILRPGIHFAPSCLGYRVTGKLSLDMPLVECGVRAVTKDRTFVVVEGFIQYQTMAKEGFDLVVTKKGLRDAFRCGIFLKVVEMDYASIFKKKDGVEKHVEEILEEIAHMWGIGACRVIVVNIKQFNPKERKVEWFENYEKDPEPKWTPAIEAFKLRAEAEKKKGKDFSVRGKATRKEKAKKIQPMDVAKGDAIMSNVSLRLSLSLSRRRLLMTCYLFLMWELMTCYHL